jgi:hypothetical protein
MKRLIWLSLTFILVAGRRVPARDNRQPIATGEYPDMYASLPIR